jgi:hypothetical protein
MAIPLFSANVPVWERKVNGRPRIINRLSSCCGRWRRRLWRRRRRRLQRENGIPEKNLFVGTPRGFVRTERLAILRRMSDRERICQSLFGGEKVLISLSLSLCRKWTGWEVIPHISLSLSLSLLPIRHMKRGRKRKEREAPPV